MHQLKLISTNEADTKMIGKIIAENIPDKTVIALTGDLAAGKTALSHAIFQNAGYLGPFGSPTYTIINEYPSPAGNAYHLDVYRLSDPSELVYTGYEDCVDTGSLVIIEWAELIDKYLPEKSLKIKIDFGNKDQTRLLTLSIPDFILYQTLKEKMHAYSCD